VVAHTCNPISLEGSWFEANMDKKLAGGLPSEASLGKKFKTLYKKKPLKQKGLGGMVHVVECPLHKTLSSKSAKKK
jgi:hypothetical protein